jgi:hypothetical protein
MTDENQQALQAATDGELRLLDPAVRASPAQVSKLLDPDLAEIGASGPVKVSKMSGAVLV